MDININATTTSVVGENNENNKADEEAQPMSSVMEEYKAKKAALLRAVLEREEREKQEELSKLSLQKVPSLTIEQIEKMSSGEKSKMRRAIMLNHQITESRAKATAAIAKKVEENIKEKVEKFTEIKEEYNAKLNEINDGFVDHLHAIQE